MLLQTLLHVLILCALSYIFSVVRFPLFFALGSVLSVGGLGLTLLVFI